MGGKKGIWRLTASIPQAVWCGVTGTSADYTTMQEGLISIPCKFEGKPGNYLAKIWQDRDWGGREGPDAWLQYRTDGGAYQSLPRTPAQAVRTPRRQQDQGRGTPERRRSDFRLDRIDGESCLSSGQIYGLLWPIGIMRS